MVYTEYSSEWNLLTLAITEKEKMGWRPQSAPFPPRSPNATHNFMLHTTGFPPHTLCFSSIRSHHSLPHFHVCNHPAAKMPWVHKGRRRSHCKAITWVWSALSVECLPLPPVSCTLRQAFLQLDRCLAWPAEPCLWSIISHSKWNNALTGTHLLHNILIVDNKNHISTASSSLKWLEK